jgi:hypothetical protein
VLPPARRSHRIASTLLALLAALCVAAAPAGAHADHSQRYGATTLKLDPGAVSALTSLGVTPAPIAPARAKAADELAFPIVNSLRKALRSGQIRHTGGISLTAGGTTVALTDFTIDLVRRQLTARVGDARVPILSLDLSRTRIGLRGGSLVIGPVGATLTDTAATALNAAFGLPAGTVPAGLKLGDATVSYRLFGGWRH